MEAQQDEEEEITPERGALIKRVGDAWKLCNDAKDGMYGSHSAAEFESVAATIKKRLRSLHPQLVKEAEAVRAASQSIGHEGRVRSMGWLLESLTAWSAEIDETSGRKLG